MLDLGWSEEYSARREELRRLVCDVLEECGAGVASLRGSWLYSDFHLNSDCKRSFSDLDLVLIGRENDDISRVRQAIDLRLGSLLRLNVAIHPLESMQGMTIQDARLLLIGEYFISVFRKVRTGYMTMDYARAKISLLFLRISREERYKDVMRRLDSDLVRRAGLVKLGSMSRFSVEDMTQCLRGEKDEIVSLFLKECIAGRPSSLFLEEWQQEVERAPSVDRWLKDLLLNKVGESLSK
jgi:hypothetical protein